VHEWQKCESCTAALRHPTSGSSGPSTTRVDILHVQKPSGCQAVEWAQTGPPQRKTKMLCGSPLKVRFRIMPHQVRDCSESQLSALSCHSANFRHWSLCPLSCHSEHASLMTASGHEQSSSECRIMSAFAFRTDYLLAVDFQTDDPIKEAASRLKLIYCSTRRVFSNTSFQEPNHLKRASAQKLTVYKESCLQEI
jgi:hypothetical protein